jgi:PAS domain S-box-containing protein
VRKDGTRFWSTARISPLEHPRYGTLWVSLHTDATEQGAPDHERFRAVFEEAPVGMAMVGNDMLIVDANRVFCELTGYSRAELVGKPFSDVEHPDDVALDAELAAKTFRGEIPRYRVEKRYVTKQGSVVPVVLRGTVVRGLDGRVLYGIAVVEETQA